MLHQLYSDNYEYNYSLDEDGRITTLFFAHPQSLLLLRQYSEVLLMDCTYKTNRFRMPLLDILGSTGLGKTFYVAFVFLSGESESDYESALKMLYAVLEKKEISTPDVVVTDRDAGLMKAVTTVFPNMTNLLCLWHINKNVLMHRQEHGVFEADTEEESGFLSFWGRLVRSPTCDEYNI